MGKNPKSEIRSCGRSRFPSAIVIWHMRFSTVLLLLLGCVTALPQAQTELKPPPELPSAEGRKIARQLIADLLSQKPTANSTNTGVVRIRDTNRRWHQVPVQIEVIATPTNFFNVYRTTTQGPASMELSIVHSGELPNEYLLRQPAGANQPKTLTLAQLDLPFAGSDFWAADLGLEFLHWPEQRVTQKKMRKSVFCDILESTNPKPQPGGYSRVVSWIGANRPDETVLVHADAYDAQGQLLKEFDPKKLEKVNGAWQLEEMLLRNVQTSSQTIFQFDLTNE